MEFEKSLKFISVGVLIGGIFFGETAVGANQNNDLQLGIDSLGNAIAAWDVVDASNNRLIQVATMTASGTWSTPATLSLTGQVAESPKIIVDSSDNAVVIWTAVDATNQVMVLYASMLVAGTGGHWTTPVQISTSQCNVASDYILVVNNNKNVVALWNAVDTTTGLTNVYSAMVKIGGSWSAQKQVSQ